MRHARGARMYGGCVSCGMRTRKRGRRARIVRLRGTGITRMKERTVTYPSGRSVTVAKGYTRSLANRG